MNTPLIFPRIAIIGFALAILGAVTAVGAGFGHRFGAWQFTTGFMLLKWGSYLALAGLATSLAALYVTARNKNRRGLMFAGAGTVVAIVTLVPPLLWLHAARSLPPIHDISTDTEHPPEFSAILPLRSDASNPAEYGGAAIAEMQHEGYPDVKPLILNTPPSQAFNAALQVAHEMGWRIVAADADQGRIEATATTFWFGFTDDVVMRITPTSSGSKVDIRSVSRVGVSDMGTNARRILKFIDTLHTQLS